MNLKFAFAVNIEKRDEWKGNPSNKKLFTISSGVMKSSIKE